MRDRPFIAASESPRPYSDVVAERRALEPDERIRDRVLKDIAYLEYQAVMTADPIERKRLQCLAEELRCDLEHQPKR